MGEVIRETASSQAGRLGGDTLPFEATAAKARRNGEAFLNPSEYFR
jgi:hypothetical protein